jgi:hypothetical protein
MALKCPYSTFKIVTDTRCSTISSASALTSLWTPPVSNIKTQHLPHTERGLPQSQRPITATDYTRKSTEIFMQSARCFVRFNHNWNMPENCSEHSKYKISRKSASGVPSGIRGLTKATNLMVTFRNYVIAPKRMFLFSHIPHTLVNKWLICSEVVGGVSVYQRWSKSDQTSISKRHILFILWHGLKYYATHARATNKPLMKTTLNKYLWIPIKSTVI